MDYDLITIGSGYNSAGEMDGWFAAICNACGAIIDDELRTVHDGWHNRVG